MSMLSGGFENFLFWLGTFVFVILVCMFVAECIRGIQRYFLARCVSSVDLAATYGRWAVVTGSTDGIGKAYAMELARKGMNICLVSRNQNKLINVANEIKNLYAVSVKWIKADFSQTNHYDHIDGELADLDDIGILVNNVGIAPDQFQPFCNNDCNFHLSLMNTNMSSMVIMTHMVLRRMIPKNKGLIVNMGSMSSIYPLPYGALYSSSKKFMDNFSLCLSVELADTNIRVHCLRPGFVRTKLLENMTTLVRFFDKLMPFLLPDAGSLARSAVPMLNISVPLYTCGFWSHSLMVLVCSPYQLLGQINVARLAGLVMKYCYGAETNIKIVPPPQRKG
ncbi:SAGA-associated factor 11 [Nesidiocoris tenuis]|uniref:SAGA-associated factor 11 n=1 Tax=Nesidiocoris tenuis TaxID=355587 RepID=A0ABN7B4E2_9HEMI|nr:SAGA-associated factor 11 [Nesidiocoris tenuis]